MLVFVTCSPEAATVALWTAFDLRSLYRATRTADLVLRTNDDRVLVVQVVLEIIAVRLRHVAPMPRHLLQTLSRLGHDDRRCWRYYNNYGRPNGILHEPSAAAVEAGIGRNGEAEFTVAEKRQEWDKTYMREPRGIIRVGQPVSEMLLAIRTTVRSWSFAWLDVCPLPLAFVLLMAECFFLLWRRS